MAITVVVASLAVAGGCARGGSTDADEPAQVALEPRFAPEKITEVESDSVPPSTTVGRDEPEPLSETPTSGATRKSRDPNASSANGSAIEPESGASPGGGDANSIATTFAAIEDSEFDTTPSLLEDPPPWSDLSGARLTRTSEGFELRVRLRGGAPATSGSEDHTMNIASFYEVDGDGTIDYEVWLNVSSGGWGASYFDNTGGGKGGFQEQSGVDVAPEGAEVVARFPLSHLLDADRFRWSLSSEWGRYEMVGTSAMVKDDLPDNDAPANFPS